MTEVSGTGNIAGWLAKGEPGRTALSFENGQSWTYRELDQWAAAIAAHLAADHQVSKGDRVAFLGFNHPGMIALLFACARLGAILVPLNWRLAEAELGFILQDSSPKVLFCSEEFEQTAHAICQDVENVSALSALSAPEEAVPNSGAMGDDLLIVYTSGTTGRPKGAVLSQRALLANAEGSIHMHQMTASDRVLVVLPLFHVGGLNIALTPALYAGATVHLHGKFDPAETLDAVQTFRPHILVLVPATLQAIMAQPNWPGALTGLRMLTTGSMIVPLPLIEAYEDQGISVVQVYGSTETCPVAAYTTPGEGKSNPRSTGRAGCRSEVRIMTPDGAPARLGEDGEIEVKGEHLMTGYWRRPEETEAAFRDGWYRTGDIGALDDTDNLYFRERSKHMIISGGENIYPAEIERVLAAVPGIAECAVCAIPDPKWGEVPAAVLVLVPGQEAPSADSLDAALNAQLARFKHPKTMKFADALPRNVMGKVVHDDLRALILGK
ncbi:MAG: long-chain fatty acid--CoA ligase [Alphaproteobacteria bacterium]|nr:long-chain fatty acid--CoA ligase [Alphaproteobacteria bacterium]